MADFCKQCSIELFGWDAGDFKKTKAQKLKKGFGWPELCEDCGPTVVNNTGECISTKCLKKHGAKK